MLTRCCAAAALRCCRVAFRLELQSLGIEEGLRNLSEFSLERRTLLDLQTQLDLWESSAKADRRETSRNNLDLA